MYILGISCFYHNSAACIIKDGKLIAAAEEERFSRKKHDNNFPTESIKFCLKEAKIPIKKINDYIDTIAFYEKPLIKFERILESHLEMWPKSFWSFYKAIPSWMTIKLRLPKIIKKEIGYKNNIMYIDHHMSHAASAYLVSPFKESTIVTIDGVGEWTTTSVGHAKNNDITLSQEIKFPHSLGLLYSAITAFLGFKVNNDEYKVMGLSAYGEPTYTNQIKKLISIKEDGSFKLNMGYFAFHHKTKMLSKKFENEFGKPRKPNSKIEQVHKDWAKSLQIVSEEIIFKILNHAYNKTQCDNLCLAGGVALNSVTNGKIISNTPFKNIFMNPNCGDGGGAMGAAFYAYNTVFKQPRNFELNDAYTGPKFSNKAIKQFLLQNNIHFKEYQNLTNLIADTAKLIKQNNIVGWFQEKMEWGPRALGARSILANPAEPNIQKIINEKVKHRELFRPFAPVICEDDVKDYFDCDTPLPKPTDFMLTVYPIKKEKQNLIPSVTHVDGTGRLQTIRKEQNSSYYNLIKEFGRQSGIPILINTSFNIRGEPIVCTPHDAYRCMMGTEIDYLVMGNYLIKRSDNPKDKWDSESTMNNKIKKGITN